MPLARIVTRTPAQLAALSEYLRARGYTVELVEPGTLRTIPAELEMDLEDCSAEEAMSRGASAVTAAQSHDRRAIAYDITGRPVAFADEEEEPPAKGSNAIARAWNGLASAVREMRENARLSAGHLREWLAEGRQTIQEHRLRHQEERRQSEAEKERERQAQALAREGEHSHREQEEAAERRALAERARRLQEEATRQAAADRARREQEEAVRSAALDATRREQEEAARQAIADRARREQEEAARRAELAAARQRMWEQQEQARREEEEGTRRAERAAAQERMREHQEQARRQELAERERRLLERLRREARQDVVQERFQAEQSSVQQQVAPAEVLLARREAQRPQAGYYPRDNDWKKAAVAAIVIALLATLGYAAYANRQPATPLSNRALVRSQTVSQPVPFGTATVPPPQAAPATPSRALPQSDVAPTAAVAPAPKPSPRIRRVRHTRAADDTIAEDEVVIHRSGTAKAPARTTTAGNTPKRISDLEQ